MIKTQITDLFGLEYPIFQGGMAWVATAELAAAVSNAGGLGIIGAGNAPASFVKEQIRKARELTDRPFGVNVMLMSPFVDEVMDVVIEEKVSVITTGAGNPGKYINRLKENNTKVVPVVPSVALAKRMESIGVDAVIAEGTESGGHIGELTTMALVPQVVDAVSIPVIAAGGIGDGRGVAAAFCLGAQGVQLGTRFVCCTECTANEKYKEYIINAKDRDAVVTGRTTGHPVRSLKNHLTREFEKAEQNGASKEELEQLGAGKLRDAVVYGDVLNGSVMAGQISGLINDIKPAKAIIEDLFNDAEKIIVSLYGGFKR
ncbi:MULTISPECIES: enoyl-[acyl-carrier-protein] reductase FabK [Thermoanaerobacterium]|uniref:Probable nitronate monooxygenase n=2 Tax=Thermoanaerobacterium TaxID=28895 RepID=W9E9B9_9THEO|nr:MULTISPECIES: enoyl-[acyl-carrier-protein] reductase FabK [Thermoanaerobacterium]AFK86757.1 enoyl-(acyl-carrier-protein) reductase II [Thermoanaerobacterium saccharolyticum JW/SL-YS485]ETO38533.1 enoyl-ACP reductase [Thermoanaerobacterium aotearoense SCUT27]